MNPVTFLFRASHTPSIPTSVGPVKATPIKFPVSHPLARQKYLLHQNKNTIQFLCALIFEALGFKKKHKDFNTYLYCVF